MVFSPGLRSNLIVHERRRELDIFYEGLEHHILWPTSISPPRYNDETLIHVFNKSCYSFNMFFFDFQESCNKLLLLPWWTYFMTYQIFGSKKEHKMHMICYYKTWGKNISTWSCKSFQRNFDLEEHNAINNKNVLTIAFSHCLEEYTKEKLYTRENSVAFSLIWHVWHLLSTKPSQASKLQRETRQKNTH